MAAPVAEFYQYLPITDHDGIRLIVLHPFQDKAAHVQCEIIHTTLAKQARADIYDRYTALSYVWGDASDTTVISVDDRPLQVTKSLESALRHMRDDKRILNVWADGICINQKDYTEKAFQVDLMGKIYATALQTVIFLGEGEQSVESMLVIMLSQSEGNSFIPLGDDKDSIAVLNYLLQSPWFYRVWIFQELVLSKDPQLQYGLVRFPWDILSGVTVFVKNLLQMTTFDLGATNKICLSPDREPSLQDGMSLYQKINVVMQMNAARVKAAQILLETPIRSSTWYLRDSSIDRSVALHQFIDILASRRGFGASDARDTIYAHPGLIDAPIIKVHYEKTIPHVFQELVKTYVVAKKFDIFAHIEDINLENRRPGLASWPVDWGLRQDNLRRINLTGLGVPFSVYGHVDHVLSSKLKCRFDGSVLRAKAHYVSSVHLLSDTLDTTSYITFSNDVQTGAISPPNTAFIDEFRINEIYPLVWLKSQLRNYPELASMVNDRFIAASSLISQLLEGVEESRLSGQSILDGRKLACLSSQKQWLALVPASTKIGDYVCFFVGYTEPFVFRELETGERAGTLRLNVNMIGECLVDGLLTYEEQSTKGCHRHSHEKTVSLNIY